MSNSHALSTIEPLIPSSSTTLLTPTSNERSSHSPDNDRHLCVMLDDRGNMYAQFFPIEFLESFFFLHHTRFLTLFNDESKKFNIFKMLDHFLFLFVHYTLSHTDLWMRFQNLTNEMIVTKNGR